MRCALLLACAALSGCDGAILGADDLPTYDAFVAAGCVRIDGYDDDAMEPFIAGNALIFNNRNDPADKTDLHWARRVDDGHFEYAGTLTGANSEALDAVGSMDRNGHFYFVSTRAYERTFATLYKALWAGERVTDAAPVNGNVSRGTPGWVNFDAEISADGDTLYFVDGRFSGAAVPDEADLVIAHRRNDAFERDPHSAHLLERVNTPALEYAPAVSTDGRELYFTRLDFATRRIGIYRAVRLSPAEPFTQPIRVAATNGFVEAPTLSADGRTMYFHRLDEGRFHVCRATRTFEEAHD